MGVGRRAYGIVALAALMPVVIGAGVVDHALHSVFDAQMRAQLMASARSHGVAVYSRLTAADQLLQQIADTDPTAHSLLSQSIFASLTVWHAGSSVPPADLGLDVAEIVHGAAGALSGAKRDSTVVIGREGSQRFPVLVRRLSPAGSAYAVGRIRPEYLWGDADESTDRIRVCIGDPVDSFLLCSRSAPLQSAAASTLPPGPAKDDEVTQRWPLFLRPRFGIDPWYIEATRSNADAQAALQSFHGAVLPWILAALLLTLLGAIFLIRRTFRPLDGLAALVGRAAQDVRAMPGSSATSNDEAGGFQELKRAIDHTSVVFGRNQRLLELLNRVDLDILSADSLERFIASSLPAVPGPLACGGAALLLALNDVEGDGMLFIADAAGGFSARPSLTARHDLPMAVEHDVPQSLSETPVPALVSLGEAGFHAARAFPLREGGHLIGALLLLDPPPENSLEPGYGTVIADRLSVAVSHVRRKQDLHRNAYFDPLTGLANRELLRDRIGQALTRGNRERHAAVILIGIDRFKNINETLGHRAGDELLKLAAVRLRAVAAPGDTVARLIGDEFMVLMTSVDDPAQAVTLAESLEASFKKPFLSDGIGYVLSLSMGIAMAPGDGRTAEVLIRNADIAMRRAKGRSGGSIVFFEETMNAQAKRRFRLEHGLRAALDRGELEVHFQPQIELRSRRVVGAEALLRWTHPSDGPIPPSVFIPIAEETGLIVPIGYWVIEESIRRLAEWRAAGLDVRRVAVNLSLRQLRDGGFVAEVARRIQGAGLSPGSLELEVTESTIAERAEELPGLLQTLREHAVRIAIDDFGTGYSSLAMLRLLPIDVLKVDRAFVGAMEPGGTGEAIASAIIAMGLALGKELVAEGIETAAQARVLEQRGCHIGQGFHISAALPSPQFEQFCRHRDARFSEERHAAAI